MSFVSTVVVVVGVVVVSLLALEVCGDGSLWHCAARSTKIETIVNTQRGIRCVQTLLCIEKAVTCQYD